MTRWDRLDRRWPPPEVAGPLRIKYGDVAGIGGYVHAELTCEYYDRNIRIRYPIHVGRWQAVRGIARQQRWVDHGRVAERTPVTALGFGNLGPREGRGPERGIRATVAVVSPSTGEYLALHLPLGEVILGRVLPGWPRPWRNWMHDPTWGRLWYPQLTAY